MRTTTAVLAALLLAAPASAQRFSAPEQPAPPGQPGGQVPGAKEVTFPTGIYDERADGAKLIREAAARARADGKRVLVMWGENYCGFCAYMKDLLEKEDPRIAQLIEAEYEVVKVDIGKDFMKHRDLQLYYGSDMHARDAEGKGPGAPALTVVDPSTDKAVGFLGGNAAVAQPMTAARVFDADVIHSFLLGNIAPPRAASTVLLTAQQRARRDGKPILVYFGATGCQPCKAWRRWLADPAVEAALAKGFVVARIDAERMLGGRGVLDKYAGKRGTLPPHAVVIDAQGKPLPQTPETGWALSERPADGEEAVRALAAAGGLNEEDTTALLAALEKASSEPVTEPAPN